MATKQRQGYYSGYLTGSAVVAFAIAYNAVAVALCLGGFLSPLLAAILMPASSLVSLVIVFAGFSTRRCE